MAGDEAHHKDDSTGFSALSAPASERPAEERPATQRGQVVGGDDSRSHSRAGKPADTASPNATTPPAQRPGEHAKPTRSEPPGAPQRRSSSRKWIWLVLIGAVAFYVFQETRKPERSELTFSKPPAGRDNVLVWNSEQGRDLRSGTKRTKDQAVEALRRADPEYYGDWSDEEIERAFEEHFGQDGLNKLTEILGSGNNPKNVDTRQGREADRPATAPTEHSAQSVDARAAPRPTEQALKEAAQATPSANADQESPQGPTEPGSAPLTQANRDTDTAKKNPVGAADSARDRSFEGRPSQEQQGAPEVEGSASEQASEETGDSEVAYRGTGPEEPGESQATKTQGADEDPPSSRRQMVREIQMYLTALGYEPGPIDGLYGRRTKRAIEAFERDMGITPTGEATSSLWRKVRDEVKAETEPQRNLSTTLRQ